MPFLKLAIFIVFILISSKLLQNIFGQTGLLVLTFLVSLFEIHGSIITNVQLYESGTVTIGVLGHLIAISIVASYLSKIFLISTFGNGRLRSSAIMSTTLLFLALSVSWIISVLI